MTSDAVRSGASGAVGLAECTAVAQPAPAADSSSSGAPADRSTGSTHQGLIHVHFSAQRKHHLARYGGYI